VTVAVRDEGPGIDPEQIPHLAERFLSEGAKNPVEVSMAMVRKRRVTAWAWRFAIRFWWPTGAAFLTARIQEGALFEICPLGVGPDTC